MMKAIDKPSAELRLKFSMICGEKTTTQHAIDIEPAMPLMASKSRWTILASTDTSCYISSDVLA